MTRIDARRTLWIGCCIVVAGLALAACRENEQGRTIDLQKGAYPGGKPSTSISEDALGELRHRALRQSFN